MSHLAAGVRWMSSEQMDQPRADRQ